MPYVGMYCWDVEGPPNDEKHFSPMPPIWKKTEYKNLGNVLEVSEDVGNVILSNIGERSDTSMIGTNKAGQKPATC